jgi:hypothetical protein
MVAVIFQNIFHLEIYQKKFIFNINTSKQFNIIEKKLIFFRNIFII